MDFRVDLEIFRGPLDLLLYLVRRHELEVVDVAVAAIADQYLDYLTVVGELDVGAVGDFLATASTLMEIKSHQVLPHADEVEDALEDPRRELVHRLLEYKKFRDAASILEERSRWWQRRYPRLASDLPPRARNLAEEPIHEVELWDLVSAFGRIIRDTESAKPSSIVYDDTPIHVFMERIHARVCERGQVAFSDLFEPGMHKSTMIGIFLAVLELVRHVQVRVEQNKLFGEIWLLPRRDASEPLDPSKIDNYDHAQDLSQDASPPAPLAASGARGPAANVPDRRVDPPPRQAGRRKKVSG
jgi:segregation and condensation protein A